MNEDQPWLMCVIAWSDRRNLCSRIVDLLQGIVGMSDFIRLGDDALVVYAFAAPEEVRDLVGSLLDPDESVLVFEFEKWSGRGPGVDAEWLMRRGH
jgi:hypothetical protein